MSESFLSLPRKALAAAKTEEIQAGIKQIETKKEEKAQYDWCWHDGLAMSVYTLIQAHWEFGTVSQQARRVCRLYETTGCHPFFHGKVLF